MHDKTYMLLLGGVFFNMDALKNHLKIKITGSEKAQMSEEQNT